MKENSPAHKLAQDAIRIAIHESMDSAKIYLMKQFKDKKLKLFEQVVVVDYFKTLVKQAETLTAFVIK